MKRLMTLVKEERFKIKTDNGFENHRIDQGGNHFIDGKCVNPQRSELREMSDGVWRHPQIGSTYPTSKKYPPVIKVN